jgi:SAM-dependent methyltransferase
MPPTVADALVLTFTTGMSLRAWEATGMLRREWALYDRLRAHYGKVVLVTYGGPDDAKIGAGLGEGVHIVCNEAQLDEAGYLAGVPGRVRGLLAGAKTAVVKTNQMMGGHAAVSIARNLREAGMRVGLEARGGYHWSRFAAFDQGAGSPAAREAMLRERELCLAADMVVGTSPAMVGDLTWAHGLDPERAVLIPNYVLPDIPVRGAGERQKCTVMFAGQLVARKRVDMIIEALALLREAGSEAELLIIGTGPEEARLKALAAERGVTATFEPRMPHDEMLERMSKCTVYMQASSMEGHPKTVIEAMATGAPVIVTTSPGLGRVVQHGMTGLVMPPDPAAFARALEGLLGDEAWREALGTAAMAEVTRTMSLDCVLEMDLGVQRRALELAGSKAHPPIGGVRFDPELLEGDVETITETWARALQGFSRRLPAKKRAQFLMALDTPMYHMQGAAAVEADGGLHPKHRLMQYHDFFVDRIKAGEKVLDLGCGVGALAASIAERSKAEVTGMDWSEEVLSKARQRAAASGSAGPNLKLTYSLGDITKDQCKGQFDTIVLSNVLEHIAERPKRLREWASWYGSKKFLIRVPAFDREWRAPFKKELGVEWRLDDTHETEYTREQLEKELGEAGLKIRECVTRWGEYWVLAEAA